MLNELNVAVIGANGLFRAGIASLLAPVAHSVRELPDIDAMRGAIPSANLDLALLDLPALNGHPATAIARIREMQPHCRVAVLSDELDSARLTACFAGGADGFLLKDISADTLIESLRLLVLGEKVFPSSLAGLICGDILPTATPEFPASDLSQREHEILRCLVEGDSNKRIANRLHITEATVKVHLKSILRKTHAANRTQAAIWALQRGMRNPTHEDDVPEIFKSEAPVGF